MFLSFIIEIAVVALLSLFQLTGVTFLGAVKPDLALLIILSMGAYDKRWTRRLSWLILSAAILKFTPGIDWRLAIFAVSAVFGIILIDYLPWTRLISFIIAVVLSGFMVNLRLFGMEWSAVSKEIILDLVLGIIMFLVASLAYGKKEIH